MDFKVFLPKSEISFSLDYGLGKNCQFLKNKDLKLYKALILKPNGRKISLPLIVYQ